MLRSAPKKGQNQRMRLKAAFFMESGRSPAFVRRKKQADAQRDQHQRPPLADQRDEVEFEQVEIDAEGDGADDDQGDGGEIAFHAHSLPIRRGARRRRLRRRGSASASSAAAAGW